MTDTRQWEITLSTDEINLIDIALQVLRIGLDDPDYLGVDLMKSENLSEMLAVKSEKLADLVKSARQKIRESKEITIFGQCGYEDTLT